MNFALETCVFLKSSLKIGKCVVLGGLYYILLIRATWEYREQSLWFSSFRSTLSPWKVSKIRLRITLATVHGYNRMKITGYIWRRNHKNVHIFIQSLVL